MLKSQGRLIRQFTLVAALASGYIHSSAALRAATGTIVAPQSQVYSEATGNCPSRAEMGAVLGEASDLMRQSKLQDAAALLQPLFENDCDARISLLLAAAYEGQGDKLKATAVLRHAHSAWPLNNNVAASLARNSLAGGDKAAAVKALAHFHATQETPEQEQEMAVVVYLADQQLIPAQRVAEEDYKYYPSLHSFLLLANTLQLQGRYPDVKRLLEGKRTLYGDSPEFLVTLAESESDASTLPAAREDLQRAISLNPKLYQAHYLLGNVLAKTSDLDGAISEYHMAIDLAPEQPRAYYQLALVLRSKQDDAGERHALEQALTADSHYAPAHCEIGRILLEDGHSTEAVTHLLSAIEYNPRAEEAYFLLARAYAKLGEMEKADQIVKRLQAVRAENRPAAGSNRERPVPAN